MIPAFNQSGVLPPYLPDLPHGSEGSLAPFRVSLQDFVKRFSINEERVNIIKGFLSYRKELKKIGIVEGFQWINGSFVEDVERTRLRPPHDIDIITFAYRPAYVMHNDDWENLVRENIKLFDPAISKKEFQCDAYFVDLDLPSHVIVNRTSYWYGLFSHQRESFLWKGMLEILLSDNEHDEYIEEIFSGGHKDAS